MTLREYQVLRGLDSGSTTYHDEFLAVLGEDSSISVGRYESLVRGVMRGLDGRFRRFFRIGLRWYYVPRNLKGVRFGDWVRFEGVMGTVDDDVVSVLDEVIACLSYPVFGRRRGKDVDRMLERVRGMDAGLALGVGFFLSRRVVSYIRSMRVCYIVRMMERVR